MMRVILLTCGIVLLLTCAAFFAYEFITYRDFTRKELSTLGEVIAGNSTSSLAFDNREDANEVLATLRAQKNIVGACLYRPDGTFFTGYPDSLNAAAFPPQPGKDEFAFQGRFLEGYAPVIQNGQRLGTLYLRSDLKAIYGRFQLYGMIAFVFTLLSFAFAYLFSRRLQRSISQPILHLADTARAVSEQKDYSVRAEKLSQDELGALTDAFNHMLAQIGSQSDQIRKLNLNLEEKVARRTRELEEAVSTLRRQNEFIQTIIASSVDVIAVFNRNLEFEIVNEKAVEIYRRSPQSLIGKHFLSAFPQLAGGTLVSNLQRAMAGEFVHDENYRSLVTDRHFENFFIPLRENGEVARVLLICHDITSIIQANDQLKNLNSELEKSNRDLEQFAYVASHDLQEPLRKIQLFSELSSKNTQYPEILSRYLEKINTSAARMSELIQAVLNYSRLTRKGQEFTQVDLNRIVANIRTDLELTIEEKGAQLLVTQLPVYAGNALQLHQLFLNLISNALKFCDGPPRILISAARVRSVDGWPPEASRKDADYIELRFQDNGIGFDQQYADQIFAIFQRLHNRSDYPGTGIGLALCKKIVENHGGMISVKSETGTGTTFFVYLPASGIVEPEPSSTDHAQTLNEGLRM